MQRDKDWWDKWFIGLAVYVSTASKDPSTKCGAVIATADHRIVSVGFNGLPRGVLDSESRLNNREIKYKMIVHAEANAILFADGRAAACTLYTWPILPCNECAKLIIQTDITRVVSGQLHEETRARWGSSIEVGTDMLDEAGVEVELI